MKTQPISQPHGLRKVHHMVTGMPASDGAGVRLMRIIGQPALMELDPFLLFDHFSSDNPDDYVAGFPPHPHRGFETVTYLMAGRMRHRDSAGHEGVIEAGGIQWMTAGKGIVHSEMPEQERGRLSGFQLWINLPASHKMIPPTYQEHAASALPLQHRGNGCSLRVLAGTALGNSASPVQQPLTDPLYLDVQLDPAGHFEEPLPHGHNAFIYVLEGDLLVEAPAGQYRLVVKNELAVLSDTGTLRLSSEAGARLMLAAARPLREPVVRGGPFVMNTDDELKQAFADYRAGRLGQPT